MVEVVNNSYTQGMRDKIKEAVKEFDAILKPDADTEITYLGTPQTAMSLYNILSDRGYSIKIWPARVPDDSLRQWYGTRLASIVADMTTTGHSTDPQRFNDKDLAEREASYGRSGFALQFMLDTSLSDAYRYPLRLSDFIVMAVNPEFAPEKILWASGAENRVNDLQNIGFDGDAWYKPMGFKGEWRSYDMSVMFIDPSGRGADECAWCILKSQGVNLYLVSEGGHKCGYSDEGMKILHNEAKKHKVNLILVESNFGDGMFTQLLQPWFTDKAGYACTIEEINNHKQKELRIIDTLEPLLNQHRIIVDRHVIEQDFIDAQDAAVSVENGFVFSLFYQLTHITRDRNSLTHDDRVDAFAGCAARFMEIMNADQDTIMENAKIADLEADAEVFLGDTDTSLLDMVLLGGDSRKVLDKLGVSPGHHGKRWVQA